ncbi:hypothetical protein [Luteimonas gilva]|uniref:hypothetical protein n=1 Tax=Luteimonas gilva TaxID=2572684 RepID=UPI0026AF9F56
MAYRTVTNCFALAILLTSAGCGLRGAKQEPPPSGETFGADDTYSRVYSVAPGPACEASPAHC